MKKFIPIIGLLLSTAVCAQQEKATVHLKYGAYVFQKRTDSAMQQWRSNRFGQFLHWGLYAIPGGEWKGKVYSYAAEFLASSANVPPATWDSLMYQFNPTHFNPTAWATMDRDMGVRYMTITTKHHEGFCLWPSIYSTFTVAQTPYKKDLLEQLVKAYNAAGIDVNFYYSILDWHNPDWRYDVKTAADSAAFTRYLAFARQQLVELVTRYPTVKGLWFDGTWDQSYVKMGGQWSFEMEQLLKRLRPGLVINSRMRVDERGARHRDSNGQLMGDYASGYERRLPEPTDTSVTKTDWEACMTIPENQWGFHKDWSLSYVKTGPELIEMLVRCTSLGGNFLLNFGPRGDGTFRSEEQQIAHNIGVWMKENSTAIYDCGFAGWQKQDWGYYTRPATGPKVYAIVFNVPVNKKLRIKTPSGLYIAKVTPLKHPDHQLVVQETGKQDYLITLPQKEHKVAFVLVVEYTGKESIRKNYQAPKV